MLGALLWTEHSVEKTDFSVTYIGARMVYLGLGSKLYDLAEQHKLKSSLLPHSEPLIYEHPPFEALILSPLGALPYPIAYFVWGLVNTSTWLLLPWLLRPFFPAPLEDLSYFALWMIFAPLGITLFQGQSSLVLLLLYSCLFISLKGDHEFWAGLFLGLGLVKFQFVIPFLLIFVVRKRWGVVRGFCIMAAFLCALSFVSVGWNGIRGYIQLLVSAAIHPDNITYGAAVDMATIQGLVYSAVGNIVNRVALLLLVAGISGSLIFWTARGWDRAERHGEPGNDLMFAAATTVSLITGSHMFTHDLSPLILAMLLVTANLSNCKQAWLRYTLLGCLILFWIPPVYFILLSQHQMNKLAGVLLVFALGTTALARSLLLQPHSLKQSPSLEVLQKVSGV